MSRTPTEYDQTMGRKLGEKAASLLREGRSGAVAFLMDQDPRIDEPKVLDLKDVSDKNTLDLVEDEILKENRVYWEKAS